MAPFGQTVEHFPQSKQSERSTVGALLTLFCFKAPTGQ